MFKVAFFLVTCLACASHGHRLQTTTELRQGDSLDSVATLLLALNPAVAFAPSLPQAQYTLTHPGRGPLGVRPLELYMQEGAPPQPEETVAKVETGDVATPAKRKPKVPDAPTSTQFDLKAQAKAQASQGAGFNQFDPLLSLSNFISRRFGLGGGLAFVALLVAFEGNEIYKGLQETASTEVNGELITTASGLQYRDQVITKAGDIPTKGNIVGFDAKVSIGEKVLFDTKGDKPIAFKFGARPFENIICEGVEEGLKGMHPGSKRILYVPTKLGPPGVNIPAGLSLNYEIELKEVLPNYFLQ